MAGAVTGATLRGLRAVDIHKEAKVEELDWSSDVAPPGPPSYSGKVLRGGAVLARGRTGRGCTQVNVPIFLPPAGGVWGHLGNR